MTCTIDIHTVTEGKVISIKKGQKSIIVDPPILFNRYPFDVLHGYLTVYADLHENRPLTVEMAPEPTPQASSPEKALFSTIPEDVKLPPEMDPNVPEPPTLEEEAISGEMLVVDVRLKDPESCVKQVPRVQVEQFIAQMLLGENQTVSSYGLAAKCGFVVKKNSTGTQAELPYYAMIESLVAKGVVKKNMGPTGKRAGSYTLTWDWDQFKQYVKSHPYEITAGDMARKFWITEPLAAEKLEDAVDRGFLERHPRKEGQYDVDPEWLKKIGGASKANTPKVEHHYGGGIKQLASEFKWPHPSEFKFVKKSITCTHCKHGYGHSYSKGSINLCGGCYQKIGGVKSHGEGATIANARK